MTVAALFDKKHVMNDNALEYITVKGFKSIASIEKLPLKPINVLIGANGSGKSNFIGVFAFLHAVREGQLQDYVGKSGGSEQVLHFGSKVSKQIEVHVYFMNEVNQYRLLLKPSDYDSLFPSEEEVYYWNRDRDYPNPYKSSLRSRAEGFEAAISNLSPEKGNPSLKNVEDWVKTRLGLWRIYHVHDTSASSPMRKTAKINDNSYLKPDGSNLPAFLYLLKELYPDSYKLIRHNVQRVAPYFEDFILRPDELNDETIRLVWKHKNSDQYFSASALSDGSLRFIVLATLLLQPQKFLPSVILVDEPELGLHPSAITLLASMVEQASLKTQVILATQSSLLLDHFKPSDVLVAERNSGATELRRLDSSDLDEWLEDYSLGQLWEKNELGGRPR